MAMTCLMCLKTVDNKSNFIRIDSARWHELDIVKKIEKHFWSLITMKCNSFICLSCWQEVDNFHKFYLQIEEAHMKLGNIKLECEDELPQVLNNDNREVLDEDKMKCCLSEPEILIYEDQSDSISVGAGDKEAEITESLDSTSRKHTSKRLNSQKRNVDNDPLKKIKNVSEDRSRKTKHFKAKAELKNSIDNKAKGEEKVQKEAVKLNINVSVSESDNDDEATDVTFKPNENSSDNGKIKANKSYSKYQINREENDKFIGEYFKQISCNICQTPLGNFSAIHKHFLKTHQQKKGYIFCCNRKFFSRRDLVDHIYCHLNPNHFKCTKCDKVLSDRVRLDKHHARVHGSVEFVKKHCCDICAKSFLDIHDLNMHKLTHLSEEEKKFPCKDCGKFYGSSYLLHRHMQAVHLKKFFKVCYICGISLSSSTALKIHMNKHEGVPQPIINCDVCGLLLTTERGLKRHKDSQHPVDGKKDHHCPSCPKISPTLKALRKHISTMHGKSLNHKCTICQKSFKRAEVLREHMASHTGTPLYTCPWCPKTFNSNSNMHAHRKKIHPKEWEEAKLKKYSGNLKPTIANNDPTHILHNGIELKMGFKSNSSEKVH